MEIASFLAMTKLFFAGERFKGTYTLSALELTLLQDVHRSEFPPSRYCNGFTTAEALLLPTDTVMKKGREREARLSGMLKPGVVMGLLMMTTRLMAADKQVEIRGRLLVDEKDLSQALMVVEVNGIECIPMELFSDGRFEVKLPAGSTAHLRFEMPGYLTKEVTVDTQNATLTEQALKKNKLVRFDVQMSPEFADKSRVYDGPVGEITFNKGSGLMKVRYDRTLTKGTDVMSKND
jgi:hypothetical protein